MGETSHKVSASESAFRFLWVLVLLTVPITTPPFLPLAYTVAKPVSAIPALLIIILALVRGRSRFNRLFAAETLLLLSFLGYTLVAGFFLARQQPQESFKSLVPLMAFGRAWASLLVGVAFYAAFRLMVVDRHGLQRTEFWLSVSVAASALLAVLQALAAGYIPWLRPIVQAIINALVETATTWTTRFHGLAYEPSWLASQITLLLVPTAAARIVAGTQLGVVRLGSIRTPYELLFLVASILGLAASGSRTGVLAFAAMAAVGVVTVLLRGAGLRAISRATLVFAVSILLGLFVTRDVYVRSAFETIPEALETAAKTLARAPSASPSSAPHAAPQAQGIPRLASRASIVSRMAAWTASWRTFVHAPFFGVGLGNSPRFFQANVPEWARSDPEVKGWLSNDPARKPNPKNMVARLLSETGIVGLVIFGSFVWCHFRSRGRTTLHLALLRNTALVGILFDYLSLDTFALPAQWFLLGLVLFSGRFEQQDSGLPARQAAGPHPPD